VSSPSWRSFSFRTGSRPRRTALIAGSVVVALVVLASAALNGWC
jgi:hypothetical protein